MQGTRQHHLGLFNKNTQSMDTNSQDRRGQLYALHKQLTDEALNLMKLKNQDYAKGDDPFLNFRSAQVVGVEVSRGILVRLLDKLSRAGNLIGKEPAVTEEKLKDTVLDIINYAILFHAVNDAEKNAD